MDKKVLVAEKIDGNAVKELKKHVTVVEGYNLSHDEIVAKIKDYDGIIIRSGTTINEEFLDAAKKLKIIGRAGNGTDNIDIGEATKRGVIVANTPESNTMSAAEMTTLHILSQSRNIIQANQSTKKGEWKRAKFKGNDVYKQTRGIIGLGRIGALVAKRMSAFDMKVIAYDPYIQDNRFKRYNVEKCDTLEDLIKASDYITVHTPKNKETYHMINESHIPLMKKGVRITNVARGGIIKEAAIKKGLEENIIASAAIDVHEEEPCNENNPLFEFDNVSVTPHLGASTLEAQANVGMNVVEQVIKALDNEIVPNALNIPTMNRKDLELTKPYIDIMEKLGKVYFQISKKPVSLVEIEYCGKLANMNNKLVTLSFMKGLLETVSDHRVNYINADIVAKNRGITVNERQNDEFYNGHTEFVKVRIKNGNTELTMGCTVSSKNEGRLAEFDGYDVDIVPGEFLYIIKNNDIPGVVGLGGNILG
jgi:D-3-phosphoglycerate dehydrogenase